MGAPAATYATSSHSCGSGRANLCIAGHTRSLFGDLAVLGFLLAQALDGTLTYIGVHVFGVGIEANPLIGWLIASFGEGPALTGAKLVAGLFGIALHLSCVHRVVAGLAAFYVAVAVLPWLAILYF